MTNNLQPIPAYVYKITCLPTGEYYFGFRAAHIKYSRLPEEDLWIHYFTSSNYIKDLINQYTISQFKASVIATFDTPDEAFWAEQGFIKDNIANKLCLNRNYIDNSTHNTVFHTFGRPLSEDQRKTISDQKKGKPLGPSKLLGRKTHKPPSAKTHEATKGTKWYNNGLIEKRCYSCPEGFSRGKLSKGGIVCTQRVTNRSQRSFQHSLKKQATNQSVLFVMQASGFYTQVCSPLWKLQTCVIV